MKHISLLITTISIFLLLNSSQSFAQLAESPCPMYLHDAKHSGRYSFTGPETPCLKWTYTTGGPINACSVIGNDGTIYLGSYDHKFYAVNPNGTLKWSFNTAGIISQTAALDENGIIYFGSYDHFLYALYPSGNMKWSYDCEEEIYSSPAIGSDGTIYTGAKYKLFAINPNGTLKHSYSINYGPFSPAIGEDGTIYYSESVHYVWAMNPDFSIKWKAFTNSSYFASPTIGNDGSVYQCVNYVNKLFALNPDNGSINWTYQFGGINVYATSTIGADGTIYSGHETGLHAFEPNGTLKWTIPTIGGVRNGPAIDSNGTLYYGVAGGDCWHGIIAAYPADGSIKWTYQTVDFVNPSPAMNSDGTLYFGTADGKLYALSEAPTPPSNAITLENFSAKAKNDKVILNWKTGTEIDNLGFYLVKSENIASGYILLDKEIIPAQGNPYSGHSYEYIDEDIESGHVYYYWLADLDVYGSYKIHGPVKVITNLATKAESFGLRK